ncbi:MAG: hypothetical protein M9887_04390 [Chitinophagales bacterium]|nr:hypothetical protein [Chitinophagales bacterium]
MVATESGTYPYTYTDNNGCTNTLVTVLTVNPIYEKVNQVNICQGTSYTLPNGESVSEAGTYPVTLQSSAGCDSTIVTYLTVSEVIEETVHASICQGASYELPDGVVATESGTYPYTYTDNNGCTNTLVTVLTVNPIYRESQPSEYLSRYILYLTEWRKCQ